MAELPCIALVCSDDDTPSSDDETTAVAGRPVVLLDASQGVDKLAEVDAKRKREIAHTACPHSSGTGDLRRGFVGRGTSVPPRHTPLPDDALCRPEVVEEMEQARAKRVVSHGIANGDSATTVDDAVPSEEDATQEDDDELERQVFELLSEADLMRLVTVSHLHVETTEEDVYAFLERFGDLSYMSVRAFPALNKPSATADVVFRQVDGALRCYCYLLDVTIPHLEDDEDPRVVTDRPPSCWNGTTEYDIRGARVVPAPYAISVKQVDAHAAQATEAAGSAEQDSTAASADAAKESSDTGDACHLVAMLRALRECGTLAVPKNLKQILISPPPSPPAEWCEGIEDGPNSETLQEGLHLRKIQQKVWELWVTDNDAVDHKGWEEQVKAQGLDTDAVRAGARKLQAAAKAQPDGGVVTVDAPDYRESGSKQPKNGVRVLVREATPIARSPVGERA